MHCDCQAAISIAKNKAFNGKDKHIRLRHEVVKQLLIDGIISIDYVKSEVNLANPLTKALYSQPDPIGGSKPSPGC